MKLLADRFVRLDPPLALDLASGRLVWWRGLAPADAAAAARWCRRCSLVSRLRHPNLAPLVDFGTWGTKRRFEAYDADGSERSGARCMTRALRDVREFLGTSGLGAFPDGCAGLRAGEPVWIPQALPGVRRQEGRRTVRQRRVGSLSTMPAGAKEWIGLTLVIRPALAEAVAALDEAGHYASGPESIVVRGPRGAGRTTLLLQLAREARLRGYVPVTATLLAGRSPQGCGLTPQDLRALLAGRHLCVIADDAGARRGGGATEMLARALPLAGRLGTRAHVVLFAVGADADDRPGIDLTPLTIEELQRMVQVGRAHPRRAVHLVARAAARAEGRPGTFLRLLERALGRPLEPWLGATGPVMGAVAERRADYMIGARTTGRAAPQRPLPDAAEATVGPPLAPRRLEADRERGDVVRERARQLIAQGRHAGAERLLRTALAAASRRDHHTGAALAALGLGRLLMTRGRAADAVTFFDEAREGFSRAGVAAGCIVAGAWAGLACTDEGRLLEAETTLEMTALAARELGEPRAVIHVGLALARCRFWQGRHDEARVTLERLGPAAERASQPDGLPGELWDGPDPRVVLDALAARVAVGEERLARAGRWAQSAMDRAAAIDQPQAVAVACAARAFVCLRMGEVDALGAVVRTGLAAARQARTPQQAVRLRALWAQGLLDAGRLGDAGRLMRRLERTAAWTVLPRLLRARVLRVCGSQRSADLPASRAAAEERFVRETGAAALSLFGAPGAACETAGCMSSLGVQHVVSLLQLCHESGDERTTLSRVSAFVRERLRAAGVAFCARDGSRLSTVAWAGGRTDRLETAARAIDLDHPTAPLPCRGGIERAVPIRLGRACVGAILCRWTAGTGVDQEMAGALLAAAAAATAMVVRLLAEALRPAELGDAERRLIGASPVMADLRQAIARAARAPFGVLIEGESGSGKELVARAIHRLGPRRERRFCTLNCAAIPDELLEGELFGHARGAFTGATTERPGLFEEADGGTLFMDEVGELSARAQAKVLRVLQEGEIRRLGETAPRRVDVRIVAATNRSLHAEATAGRFRLDLLYRLDVVRIVVPPLRDRIGDVPLLAAHFWRRAAARTGCRAVLAPDTLAALARHDWPGNVRELQNVLYTLAVSGPRRGCVTLEALPTGLAAPADRPETLDEARRACEARVVRAALARAGGHRARAAAELGLTRQGLAKLVARLGLTAAEEPTQPVLHAERGRNRNFRPWKGSITENA